MEALLVLGLCLIPLCRCIVQENCRNHCRIDWWGHDTWDEEAATRPTRQARKGEVTYPNGDFYVGELVDDVKHGFGKLIFAAGSEYMGQFANGKFHGEGCFTYASKDVYKGQFIEGMSSGPGKLTFVDGSEYQGQFARGKFHGSGCFTYPNGVFINATWVDGEMQYQENMVLNYPNGGQYTGEIDNSSRHGMGTMLYSDGSAYRGLFIGDKRNGQGKLTYRNGNTYVGDFVDNKKHGEGVFTSADGTCYEGSFRDDKKHGRGTWRTKDGLTGSGLWKDGKKLKVVEDESNVANINIEIEPSREETVGGESFTMVNPMLAEPQPEAEEGDI